MSATYSVAVQGSGVAASCAQFLLRSAGVDVVAHPLDRPRVPGLMLSPATQTLLADVFAQNDLLHGLWPIRRRIVAWGSSPPVSLAHQGVVVSEQELLRRLQCAPTETSPLQHHWTLYTSRPPESSLVHSFGDRIASAAEIALSDGADSEACLMESLPAGWLFLLPVSPHTAWLLTAGAPREALLAESRLVSPNVAGVVAAGGSFPSHPRINHPLAGDGWLACGSAALGFDPLCGDGTGHAIRQAILACAIVRAPGDHQDLLWEYRLRLWAGFRRHLELGGQFYSTGGSSDWWRSQAESLRQGLAWLSRQDAPAQLGKFRLNGFNLDRVDAA